MMSPDEMEMSDEEADELATAPESGQPQGGRHNPWDDDDEGAPHAWPADHHAAPKDEL
jgi:hypothetical protein